MSYSLRILLFVPFALLVGCDQTPPPAPAPAAPVAPPPAAGTVGTINVDFIMEQLGFTKELMSRAQSYQQQIDAEKKRKLAELETMRKGFGDKPSEEQIKNFRKADMEAAEKIRGAEVRAQQEFNKAREYVQNVLVLSLKEPVEKITKRRGLTVVLHERQGVFYHADSTDITKEVLEYLDKTPNSIKFPTMPAVQATGAPATPSLVPAPTPAAGTPPAAPTAEK